MDYTPGACPWRIRASSSNRKLSHRGYEIIDFDFDSAIASDEDFAYAIARVQKGFDRAKAELELGFVVSEREAKGMRASVGEAIHAVAAKTRADAVLLMHIFGYDTSGELVVAETVTSFVLGILSFGILDGAPGPFSGSLSEAAMIDGLTGDVLWANSALGHLDSGSIKQLMDSFRGKAIPIQSNSPVPGLKAAKKTSN